MQGNGCRHRVELGNGEVWDLNFGHDTQELLGAWCVLEQTFEKPLWRARFRHREHDGRC